MGAPMILYGLAPIADSSFEAADPSVAWDLSTLSTNGDQTMASDEVQSAGDGIPSAGSLKQNVDDGTAGNKAVAAQRFRVVPSAGDPDIADIFEKAREQVQEFAVIASLKPQSPVGWDNADLKLKFYEDDGGMTVGTGTAIASSFVTERKFYVGGPLWFTVVRAVKIDAAAPAVAFVDIELRYDVDNSGFDASGAVWWDRVFLGVLCDLSKGLTGGLSPRQHLGMSLNEGDGTAEIIKVHGPSLDLRAELRNVLRGSSDDKQLNAFARWMANVPGFLALWANRDHNTNADMHFQRMIVERSWNPRYPAGVLRRNFQMRFLAPNEGLG